MTEFQLFYFIFQKAVCEHMYETVRENNVNFDILCGIPYQGIPLATVSTNTTYLVSIVTLSTFVSA